jgi:hypothetical protein
LSDERPAEISNYMESLTSNLAPAVISGWLQRVAEYARELCPDSGIEFRTLGDFGDIVIPTKDATKCVIESVKTVEQQAPEIVKAILATYRARLEQL